MGKMQFNDGWTFGRAGEEDRLAVTLPHDAMLGEERKAGNAGGKNVCWFAGRDYVYEKCFFAPEEWRKGCVVFEFEGVYRDAKVYINGAYAGGRAYGYLPFYVDASKFLAYDRENAIRVEAFNSRQPNSRWCSGAGIYRPVWLHVLPKAHIPLEGGVRIKTLDYCPPRIAVEVATTSPGEAQIEVLEGEKVVASAICAVECEGSAEIDLPGARLWSVESPYLYTCRVTFCGDVREERFGVRVVGCSAREGFTVNGERVILRGACIHHDNGILGAAEYACAAERKIAALKKCGYNAIRSAHNPASSAVLEACDRLGMLVVDEYCDMWYIHKTKYDYADRFADEWRGDITSMVLRDFNHPSVVMYSLGNEVAETGQRRGVALVREMTALVHGLDDRPVTCGINIFFNLLYSLGFGVYSDKKAKGQGKRAGKGRSVGSEFFNDLAGLLGAATMKAGATLPGCDLRTKDAFAAMDVAGYNYGILRYQRDLKAFPDRVILGTETFCSDARKFWLLAQDHPALIGDFVWTGADYLGEVGIGAWEYADYAPDFTGGAGWMTAGSGRLDLNLRPLAEAAYTRVAFGLDDIAVGVVRPDRASERHSPSAWKFSAAWPSWSWQGCDGKRTTVEVYTACPRAAVYVNGQKVGEKRVGKNARADFKVIYRPGELVAVGLDERGREVCRTSLISADEGATMLSALPERGTVERGGLCFVRLVYTDGNGVWKPLIRGKIEVGVQGGELVALGSACPYNDGGYLSAVTDTYYGEALAVVRPNEGCGEVLLRARSAYGCAEARIAIVGQ